MNTIGRYQLVEKLGQGGMGVVYRGFDPLLQRVVAVKLIGTLEANDEVKQRFFREARAAGQLSHKNIITIYDLGEHEGQPYLAMEFLEGQDLQQRVAAQPSMSLARKLDLAIEICEAIEYAHHHGVVHRDIKPANIFITSGGTAKILDFGLARLITSELTNSNMMMGTLNYMAPEQVRGERADHRSDIFSTGVVLYELFGGRKAFEGDSFGATLYKILQEVPEPLRNIDAQLPPEVVAIIERALEKGRDERYQHMSEMVRDLVAYRQQLLVSSPAFGRPAELPPGLSDPNAPTIAAPTPLPALRPPSGSLSGPGSTPPVVQRPGWSRPVAIAAMLAAVVAVVVVVMWASRRGASPPPQDAQALPSAPAPAQPQQIPSSPPAPAAPPPQTQAPAAPPEAVKPGTLVDSAAVDAARARMGTAKNAATASAAPTLAAGAFASAVSAERAALTLSRRKRNAEAVAKFSEAAGLFRSAELAAHAEATARAERARAATEKKPAEAPVGSPPPSSPPPATGTPPLPAPTQPVVPPPAPPPAPKEPVKEPAPEVKLPLSSPTSGINELLDKYKSALEGRSLDALKRIWPGLGGAQQSAIRDEFQNASRIDVEILNPQINVQGNTATVTFVRRYELHTTDRQRLRRESRTTMHLQRTGTTWIIDRMSFEPVR